MMNGNVKIVVFYIFLASRVIIRTEARGRPTAPGSNIGEYPPQNCSAIICQNKTSKSKVTTLSPQNEQVVYCTPIVGNELTPKPYSFNYEVTDEQGNTHYRREQGDPSGIVTGSYGYMNINGLYRMVEYMSDESGFKARVKTNEPGAKGPGSADVEVQADPMPQGILGMFERKATVSPSLVNPTNRPRYPMMKG